MVNPKVRALFERTVYQVTVDAGSALPKCFIPAQYEAEASRLVIPSEIADGDLIRASIAAILFHLNRNKHGAIVLACQAEAEKMWNSMGEEDRRWVLDFLKKKEGDANQARLLF